MSNAEDEKPLLRNQRCRTCLSKLGEHNIFTTNVIHMLSYLVGAQIENSDNLPSGICEDCLQNLTQAFEFKKKCEMTHSILIQEQELDEQLCSVQIPIQQTYVKSNDEINENDAWLQFQQNSIFLNEGVNEINGRSDISEISSIRFVPENSEMEDMENESHNCSNHLKSLYSISQADLLKLKQSYGLNQKFRLLVMCEYCGRKYNQLHVLKEQVEVQINVNTHTCRTCRLSFENSSSLRQHIGEAHLKNIESLNLCDSSNTDREKISDIKLCGKGQIDGKSKLKQR